MASKLKCTHTVDARKLLRSRPNDDARARMKLLTTPSLFNKPKESDSFASMPSAPPPPLPSKNPWSFAASDLVYAAPQEATASDSYSYFDGASSSSDALRTAASPGRGSYHGQPEMSALADEDDDDDDMHE